MSVETQRGLVFRVTFPAGAWVGPTRSVHGFRPQLEQRRRIRWNGGWASKLVYRALCGRFAVVGPMLGNTPELEMPEGYVKCRKCAGLAERQALGS